jgi:hypothetical protein
VGGFSTNDVSVVLKCISHSPPLKGSKWLTKMSSLHQSRREIYLNLLNGLGHGQC